MNRQLRPSSVLIDAIILAPALHDELSSSRDQPSQNELSGLSYLSQVGDSISPRPKAGEASNISLQEAIPSYPNIRGIHHHD